MLQQIFGKWPLAFVVLQALSDEIFGRVAQLLRDLRQSLLQHFLFKVVQVHYVILVPRMLPRRNLQDSASESPNVAAAAIRLSVEDLWRHPVKTALGMLKEAAGLAHI